jgi:catechol 2,3-dioxygenase-like lactoylglutathione lyase family enzyme
MNPRANAISVVVADMDRSVAFYRHLGLDFDPVGADHSEADLGNGVRLMLDGDRSIQTFTTMWERGHGSPRTTLCFQFDSAAQVDAKFGELMQAGYQGFRKPWDAPWGQRYASVIDPDGSGVDLYAVLPAVSGLG